MALHRPRQIIILKNGEQTTRYPSVGAISVMSSPLNFLSMVVLPALSSPISGSPSSRRKSMAELIQEFYRNSSQKNLLFLLFFSITTSERALKFRSSVNKIFHIRSKVSQELLFQIRRTRDFYNLLDSTRTPSTLKLNKYRKSVT